VSNQIKRILELHQIGLFNYWDLWFRPMPPQCMENTQSGYKKPKNKPKSLFLKNLTGSLFIFLREKFISLTHCCSSKRITPFKTNVWRTAESCFTIKSAPQITNEISMLIKTKNYNPLSVLLQSRLVMENWQTENRLNLWSLGPAWLTSLFKRKLKLILLIWSPC
jgi:hypothetical protein